MSSLLFLFLSVLSWSSSSSVCLPVSLQGLSTPQSSCSSVARDRKRAGQMATGPICLSLYRYKSVSIYVLHLPAQSCLYSTTRILSPACTYRSVFTSAALFFAEDQAKVCCASLERRECRIDFPSFSLSCPWVVSSFGVASYVLSFLALSFLSCLTSALLEASPMSGTPSVSLADSRAALTGTRRGPAKHFPQQVSNTRHS